MGDISELRGLVVIFSFIALLVFLIGLVPPQFVVSSYEGRTIYVPDYFEGIDLQMYADVIPYTFNETSPTVLVYEELDLGGHDCILWYTEPNETENDYMYILHKWVEWIIIPYSHKMEWRNRMGVNREGVLHLTEMNADWNETRVQYRIDCDHFLAHVFFAFNETLYSLPSEAYDMGDLHALFCINFDQTSTGYSAWDLIGMLLFFQLPEVHWLLNAIIAIPLWIAIAYISFILILRALGAIFGGGGA